MNPVPINKYRKFLKSQGLVKKRIESSHEIWDKLDDSLTRPITIDTNYKEVPILHIHTSLKTLGITKQEFSKLIKRF